ncbi:hypothetical protein JMJ77_0002256, partial [Colletotrichum scovillei]
MRMRFPDLSEDVVAD